MQIEKIDQIYLKLRPIEGWLSPHACRLFAIIDECQKNAGISGNLFEIGVWHGKSAIPLASLLAPEESLGVCDIFDDLMDDGRSAKRQRFEKNMRQFFGEPSFLKVHAKSSRDLSPEEITPRCRLIHIDGAHDSENVYQDVVLTERCLHPQGALIMDDAYQPAWPGVLDGVYRFLYRHPDRLFPVAFGYKKLVLVRPEAVALYTEVLADNPVLRERCAGFGPFLYKTQSLMGGELHLYYEAPLTRAAFCPKLVNAVVKRAPWLKNPATQWLNRRLRALRGKSVTPRSTGASGKRTD